MFEPKVMKALHDLIERFDQEVPELTHLMNAARAGKLTKQEALTQMMTLVLSRPDLEQVLLEMAQEYTPQIGPLIASPAVIEEGEIKVPAGRIMQKGTGSLMLDPFYESALIERAQFDGDIPEHRTGVLSRGVQPAVPVATDVRDPVALGLMLQDASENIEVKLRKGLQERLEAIEADPDVLDDIRKVGALVAQQDGTALIAKAVGTAEDDPPEYRRGQLPAKVKTAKPSGSALASLSREARRQSAWKFLSTTQGRQSAVTTIGALILEHMEVAGHEATERDFDKDYKGTPRAAHAWFLDLGEQGTTQSSFSAIDVAARAISCSLLAQLLNQDPQEGTLYLEITTINKYAERVVGWAARLIGG